MVIGQGAQPDRAAVSAQQSVGFGLHDQSTAGGQHRRNLLGDEAGQGFPLEAAKIGLAVDFENLGQAQSRGNLDTRIQFHEAALELASQRAAQRGLAGSPQAEKGDVATVGGGFRQQQRRHRDLKGGGQVGEATQGRVAASALDIGQKAQRQARFERQIATCPGPAFASLAHASRQVGEEDAAVLLVHRDVQYIACYPA